MYTAMFLHTINVNYMQIKSSKKSFTAPEFILVKGTSEFTNVERKSQHNHINLIGVRLSTSFHN